MILNKYCILIDDDEDDQLIFESVINKHYTDFDLLCYDSAQEGIKSISNIEKSNLSAIFLDLNMPRVNGIECLKTLRKDPKLNRTPIVIYSTSNNPQDVNEALLNKADAFITKPSKITDLVEEIKPYLK